MAYNGWPNYETWLVNTHLMNDEGSSDAWHETARIVFDADDSTPCRTFTRAEKATFALADRLRDHHDEAIDSTVTAPGVFGDLLRAALSDVDWRAIAAALVESVASDAVANR